MSKFPHSFLEEIKARIRPSEVIRRKVALKNNGREYTGLCPFHKEKSPSFTVSDEKGFYHCFGCGSHGNVINFLMGTEGLSFPEAVESLAKEAGLEIPKPSIEEVRREQKTSSLINIMNLARNWFKEQLHTPQGLIAREYLAKRAVTKEATEVFSLGYAPTDRIALTKHLKSHNITEEQILACGLLSKNDSGNTYDKFRNRLIFPILDTHGNTIAFGGRILGEGQPKYLNSPDTILFKKGHVLYNEHLARKAAFKENSLFVTEGYMDAIALYMAGIKQVVAPLGTAITDHQLLRMWALCKEPTICLDGDAAGQRAMLRAATLATPLLRPGYTLKFAVMPATMDPDDVIRSGGAQKFLDIATKSINLSEVLWQNELGKIGIKTPESRALLEKNLHNIAESIRDKQVSSHYRNFFQQCLRNAIFSKKSDPKNQKNTSQRITQLSQVPDISVKSRAGAEALLILIMLHNPTILQNDDILEEFIKIDFSSIKLDKIREYTLQICPFSGEENNKILLRTHLEKMGLRPDIIYFEGLGIYRPPGSDKVTDEEAENYWKYAERLYRAAVIREEYQNVTNAMTEESESRAFELMKQINQLDESISNMEAVFAED